MVRVRWWQARRRARSQFEVLLGAYRIRHDRYTDRRCQPNRFVRGWYRIEAAVVAVADVGTVWVEHRGATARLRRTSPRRAALGLGAFVAVLVIAAGAVLWGVGADRSWSETGLAVTVVVTGGLGAIGAWVPVSAWLEARRFGRHIDVLSLSLVRYRDGRPCSGCELRDLIRRWADLHSLVVGGKASTLALRDSFYLHPSSGRHKICGHPDVCDPETPNCLRTVYEPRTSA